MEYLLTNRAEKPLAEMLDFFAIPSSLKALTTPKVNAVWESKNDQKMQKIQKLLIKGIIAITKKMTMVSKDEQPPILN